MRRTISASVLFLLAVAAASCVLVECQETNFFNTTTYARNVSHRTDFCSLHRMTESGEIPRKVALRGTQISVGLFRYQLDEDGDGTGVHRINDLNPGAGILFLDELAARAGFTWRNSFGILDSPREGNETWGGLLEWSVDTYDLVGDWFLRTIERLGDGIVFPEGWYDGSLIMVRKKPQDNYSKNVWAFASPFTSEVWFLIIGTTIASGLVYFLLDYIHTGGRKDKMELNLVESLYISCIGFTGHLIHLPKRAAGKILTLSVCLLFLLIMAAYTANLASFLVVRNAPTLVITDITDAVKNDLSFCVLKSSTSEVTLRNEYKAARLVQRDSIGDTYLSVLAGECDIVLTTIGTWAKYERNVEYNQGCSLEWVGRVVKPFVAGFSLRDSATLCSSLLRDVLSLHMVDMKLDRTDLMIWDKIVNEKATINCQAEDADAFNPDEAKLDIYNLGGIFIIHLTALTVAIGLAAFHWFWQYKSNQNVTRENNGNILPSITQKSENGSTPVEDILNSSVNVLSPLNTSANDVQVNQCVSQGTFHPYHRKTVLQPSNALSHVAEVQDDTLDLRKLKNNEIILMAVMVVSLVALWVTLFLLMHA